MELAPELQFKHYTLAEAQLPAEAVIVIEGVAQDQVAICCDLETHVFNPEHTDPQVAEALRATHWFDLREWSSAGPRTTS
jgi:hypothetical protein